MNTLSLPDELPITPDKALRQNMGMVVERLGRPEHLLAQCGRDMLFVVKDARHAFGRHLSQSGDINACRELSSLSHASARDEIVLRCQDRKSTRLNSSH